MRTIGYIAAVLAFLLLSAMLGYCFLNESGHGPCPGDYVFWFFPVFLCSAVMFWARHSLLGLSLALNSALGVAFTLTAAPLRIMMGYECWIEEGMPPPNSLRIPILAGFFFVSLVCVAMPFLGRTRKRGKEVLGSCP